MSLVEKALLKIRSGQQKPGSDSSSVVMPASSVQKASVAGSVTLDHAHTPNPSALKPTGPVLEIDLEALRAVGLLAPVGQAQNTARQLRAIKQSLLRRLQTDGATSGNGSRTVMLTSGIPGDGKTYSAFNLALSLALEKDFKVILVDADVAKPHITSLLGLAGQRGLMDVLVESGEDIESVLRATNIAGFYFVPAGKKFDTATELLSSGRMTTLIGRLTDLEPNLLVIFDSPPMLLTSEAQALIPIMNQILVVVRSGVTPRAVVKHTLEILRSVGDERVALLLNDAKSVGPVDYAYGYGYGQ